MGGTMEEQLNTLRIGIDGHWSAQELGGFFVSLADIYNLHALLKFGFS